MAILVHHRDFDQETPHEAARAALSQADLWGAAEALGLQIVPDLDDTRSGMDLYVSGPLHHIMDLYDEAVAIGTLDGVRYIEVDCKEDEAILRRCLGDRLRILNPANQALKE